MTSNPLVSIIIPVYNGANYVGEAIQSALAQTYPNIEVLVVDDGSTDGGATRAVIESFGDRIRSISQPNGGVASALNTGITHMRGSFFSWLSHDDLYRPEKVSRQVETWRNFASPCVVIGDFELMDEHGTPIQRMSVGGYNLVARPLDAVFRGLINGCALLVPRDIFDRAGLFEVGLPTTQDYHLWYRIARLAPFVHCPHDDVRQRVHALQGSRHASHLDEASRMFAHLVDITPVRTMQAYDGSELAFLLNVRHVLSPYAGLRSYLTFRIEQLLRDVRYSVVLCHDSGEAIGADVDRLNNMRFPPAKIVIAGVAEAGRRTGINSPHLPPNTLATALSGTRTVDVLTAAQRAISGGIIIFARVSRMPSETQLLSALEHFIRAGVDVGRPANVPETLSELDGLIVRRDALTTLADTVEQSRFEWETIGSKLQLCSYSVTDTITIESAEQVETALRGQQRVEYHRGLSEGVVADIAVKLVNPDLPVLLFILHSMGGGSQTHLNSLVRALAGKANCLVAYGEPNGELQLSVASDKPGFGLVFRIPDHLPDLVRILRKLRVSRVDVHQTVGFETQIEMVLDALGVPFDITLLDYHLIANNPFLCLDDGRFVGDKRLRNLEFKLLRRTPLPILRKASRVIAISRDLAARVDQLCPGLPMIPARLWHDTQARVRHVFAPRLWGNEPLRVVIAGSIEPHKGQAILMEVARIIAVRRLPIRLHLIGEIRLPPHILHDMEEALTIHGRYEAGKFAETLGSIAPHVAWLPSQVPETWSYVVTDFMDASLPITATAIGAIPERCYGRPYTWLLPLDATAADWVELFLRLHATGLKEPPRWVDIDHLPPARPIYFEEYLHPGAAHALKT